MPDLEEGRCKHGEVADWCGDCTAARNGLPSRVWRTAQGQVYHRKPTCEALRDGQSKAQRFGRQVSTPEQIPLSVAMSAGLAECFHCFPYDVPPDAKPCQALARIEVARPRPYTRLDTRQVADPSQRPTNWDYDRYLWLVGLLRKYRYDDAEIYRRYPFLIKDVFFSAVLVAANAALLGLAGVAGASDGDRGQLACWLDRGREGLARRFNAESGLCLEYDVRNGVDIRLRTFASFAPLFAGTADAGQRVAQMRLLDSGDFCGDPRLRWRLLPSTSPAEPVFEPRNYWRGPVWPVNNWLLWHSLSLLGYSGRADELRRDSLDQIAADGEFAEYFEPFSGKPLGSPRQSWTAAVALDWSAADHGR